MAEAAMQGANCTSGVIWVFPQGHLDTQLNSAGIRTSNLSIIIQPALPTELQPPQMFEVNVL